MIKYWALRNSVCEEANRLKQKGVNAGSDAQARLPLIIGLLEKEHSDAEIALNYTNPFELLIATILSAQCTDERVNIVTKTLFKKYRSPKDFADADLEELEEDVRSTGFYHNKAKNIKKCCQMLLSKFHSQVPQTMQELLELPGVARKTANIVLQNAYGIVEGIAVDTHVRRLALRLGLTENDDPNKIEQDLLKLAPKSRWMRLSDLLIFHGRRVCIARKPKCETCVVNELCPSAFKIS
jgi:endonuclease-3